MLIEFVADAVGEELGELHRLVSCLDEEIGRKYGRPELDLDRRRNVMREVRSKRELFERRSKETYGVVSGPGVKR